MEPLLRQSVIRLGAGVGVMLLLLVSPLAASGELAPNVQLPAIPRCYAFSSDKEELLDELTRMRTQAALNLPLGAEKDDVEFERASAQAKVNVQAIDDAIARARATPWCPITPPKAQPRTGGSVRGTYPRPE